MCAPQETDSAGDSVWVRQSLKFGSWISQNWTNRLKTWLAFARRIANRVVLIGLVVEVSIIYTSGGKSWPSNLLGIFYLQPVK